MMQPKINRSLAVIWGKSAASQPVTNQERIHRSPEENQTEYDALQATHAATLASRAAWQQAQTQEEADAPVLDGAFNARAMLAPTAAQQSAIDRYKTSMNLHEDVL
jgi:hypothetical protein